MDFYQALDKFMRKHGFRLATEEGGAGAGPELPYQRVYYNPDTEEGIAVVDVEDTSDLADMPLDD